MCASLKETLPCLSVRIRYFPLVFVFLIVSGKLYHCDRVKAGFDSQEYANLYAALAQVVRALGWTRRKLRGVVSATLTCRTNL